MHYDVAVIGAGPAGSATAYLFARGGLRVALLDKFDFRRDKTCGDGLTARALEVLKIFWADQPNFRFHTAHRVRALKTLG